MYSIKHQRGVATVLLVILLGITVMMITAAVAKNIGSRKEATVAAHAQTNAQIMAWAGVSAFQQYVIEQGKLGISYITALQNYKDPKLSNIPGSIPLKDTPNKIIAEQIIVGGACAPGATAAPKDGDHCTVTANITANNMPAKAATTINVVFDMVVKDGTVSMTKQKNTISLGGDTTFSGKPYIEAEQPDTDLTINATGDLKLLLGVELKNISKLTINAIGNVEVDCGLSNNCGNTVINITNRGWVKISGGNSNFGTINSTGDVDLNCGADAQNITTLGDVSLHNGTLTCKNSGDTTAKNIQAKGNVTVSNSIVNGNIDTNGNISLDTGGIVNGTITAVGDARLTGASIINGSLFTKGLVNLTGGNRVSGDAGAIQSVTLSSSSVGGNVASYGKVSLDTDSRVSSNVYARGDNITGNVVVKTTSYIDGTAYHNGGIWIGLHGIGGDEPYQPYSVFENILPKIGVFDYTSFEKTIPITNKLASHIDVRAYINEANYIFLQSNTTRNNIDRVYLNKVKNKANSFTYVADCTNTYPLNCTQSKVDSAGTKTSVSSNGFNLGDYDVNGSTYTGAICERVDATSRKCISEIIGYLPRVSMGRTAGVVDNYGFGYLTNRWRLRSLSETSDIDNATLAPGIMFFDGELEIAGNGTSNTASAFVNSLLATDNMWMDAFSPTIYAPYKVVGNGGTAVTVCDRTLKTVTGSVLTPPNTLSDKYPMPTNLCKDASTFAYNMNKKADGTTDVVRIDGLDVPKLDLGNVALMSNGNINFGSCTRIFGDVLARGNLVTSRACGINDVDNPIRGNISTQGKGDATPNGNTTTSGNSFVAGIKIKLPFSSDSNLMPPSTPSQVIDPTTIALKWTKTL